MINKKNIKIPIIIFITVLIILLFRIILSNTFEINQHNIGVSWNKVFLWPDWLKEAVFNKYGNPVTDAVNMPSYNYKNYKTEPFWHFKYDTLPWIKWWNSPDDSSKINERILAFLKDFWNGIIYTFQNIFIDNENIDVRFNKLKE